MANKTDKLDQFSAVKIKHLEFIQTIVTRLNTNSFLIKGWSIAIVSAILAMVAGTKQNRFLLIGVGVAIVFWLLDTYYLTQERRFRGLYSDVAGISKKPKIIKDFAMRPDLYTGGRYSYLCVFFSPTIIFLYLPIVAALVIIFLYFVEPSSTTKPSAIQPG